MAASVKRKRTAIAYNATSNMVYLAGDTTTAAQNFVAPNNVNLPGITNNTVNQYTVTGVDGKSYSPDFPARVPKPEAASWWHLTPPPSSAPSPPM